MENVILTSLSYLIGLHWAIVSVFAIIGVVGFLKYKGAEKGNKEAENVEFVIVTKASNSVKGVLFDTIQYHVNLFGKYQIKVVTDQHSELNGNLVDFVKKFNNVELIEVPDTFSSNAIAKGRAIDFFTKTYAKTDMWYAFIDDDNRLLDKKFLKEIPYYDSLNYVGANGILYPRQGESKLAFVADSLRYFDDLTIFRFGTGFLKKPLNGFHGELLIIKGDVLKSIGFDRYTVTEDFSFSSEVLKRGYSVWQSDTKVSILSPNSVNDFIKQRNRWYRGIFQDIKHTNTSMKLFSGIRLFDWRFGIVGSWAIFPLWFFLSLPKTLLLFNLIGAAYYYTAYSYGAMRLESHKDKLTYLFAMPLYGIMETIAPHYKPKDNGFNVIDKSERHSAFIGNGAIRAT